MKLGENNTLFQIIEKIEFFLIIHSYLKSAIKKMDKTMHLSQPYFGFVYAGYKTVEGRKCSEKWSKLQVGDLLKFIEDNDENEHSNTFLAKITHINKYTGGTTPEDDPLTQMLTNENLKQILPSVKNLEEGREVYLRIYTIENIIKDGMLAIHLEVRQ